MLNTDETHHLKFRPISIAQAKRAVSSTNKQLVYAIGHQDISSIVCSHLGIDYEVNRCTIKFDKKDHMIIAQYSGERLPEGSTQLPAGAQIKYWRLSFEH